jgi:hypothetical protein
VGTGNGDPEVPELPSVRGYTWAALSTGAVNSETWSSRLGVGPEDNNPTPKEMLRNQKQCLPDGRSRRSRSGMACGTTGEEGGGEEGGEEEEERNILYK